MSMKSKKINNSKLFRKKLTKANCLKHCCLIMYVLDNFKRLGKKEKMRNSIPSIRNISGSSLKKIKLKIRQSHYGCSLSKKDI